MTGWQIAGNVAMIGLNFAPALGAAGGAAMKMFNGPDFLKLGGCFVAGTKVHLSALPVAVSALELAYALSASDRFSYDVGFAWEEPHAEPAIIVPIEQVPLGARVATKNPEAFGAENPIPDAHESTWRLLSAEIEREDGARVEVELLRPLAWIEEQGFEPGARIYLRLEELNVAGWATIRSVDPCPPLSDGHGNLVTGRFVTRGATNLVEATFSDGTVLNGTSIHPVWSLDRMEWVALGELAIGEQVYSNEGPLRLVGRTLHNQPVDVYNIEVDCEHVYQVGDAGILVHNTYSVQLQKARGYIPQEFDIVRYNQKATWQKLGFEKHHGVLDEWMKTNVKGYTSGRAPTIVLSIANHNATRAAFNTWRAANGWSKMPIPWQEISPRQIQSLMNHLLTEARVPREAVENYLTQLNQYLYRYM